MIRRVIPCSLFALTVILSGAWWLAAGNRDQNILPAAAGQTVDQKKPTGPPSPAEKTRQALDQIVTLVFANHSLEEIADRLRTQTRLNFVIDSELANLLQMARDFPSSPGGSGPPPVPDESNLNTIVPTGLSCNFRQIQLRTGLHLLLDHYQLGYAILGDTILICTTEEAQRQQVQQLVDVKAEDAPLAFLLRDLSRTTATDIVLDAGTGKAGATRISLNVKDVRLERGLGLLSDQADLKVVALGKVLLVTTQAKAAGWKAEKKKAKDKSKAGAIPGLSSGLEQHFGLGGGLGGVGFSGMGGGMIGNPNSPGGIGFFPPGGPPARQGVEPKSPPGNNSQLRAKESDLVKKEKPGQRSVILKKLAEPITLKEAFFDNDHSLPDVLKFLQEVHGFPTMVIDHHSFKAENPDAAPLSECMVRLTKLKDLPRAKILRLVLNHIPTSNGTYLIRPGYIEVLTSERSYPDQQGIQGDFVKQPLEEVMGEFAEQTGTSILMDPRIGEQARTPITASFPNATNLVTAVRLLADMADLKLVVVDKVLYITSRSNPVVFPPADDPDVGRKRRNEAA